MVYREALTYNMSGSEGAWEYTRDGQALIYSQHYDLEVG